MPTAQDVNITILDGGLGVLPSPSAELHAVIAPSPTGPIDQPFVSSVIEDHHSTFGECPGVQSVALAIALTGAPVMFVRATTGTPGSMDTLVFTGTGTSVVTHTGVPLDAYGVIFTVVDGGTIGVAGITVQYSLDGGKTTSAVKPLGVASSMVLTTASGASSGITLNFAAGTLVAGDEASFGNTGPISAAADIAIAMQSILDSDFEIGFWHVAQVSSASDCTTYALKEAEAETAYRYIWGLYESRDLNPMEAPATWKAAIVADFSAFTSVRSSVAAGYYITTSPIDGNKMRRSLAWQAAPRALQYNQATELGKVKNGSLQGLETSKTDGLYYHDERTSPGLDAARFMTARSLIGKKGMFIKNSNIMCQPGSDFYILPYRRVMDVACSTLHFTLLDELNDDVRIDGESGFILEKDRLAIERKSQRAQESVLLSPSPPLASKVTVAVSKIDNILSTKTLTAKVSLVPKGYIKAVNATIGYVNPALGA